MIDKQVWLEKAKSLQIEMNNRGSCKFANCDQ